MKEGVLHELTDKVILRIRVFRSKYFSKLTRTLIEVLHSTSKLKTSPSYPCFCKDNFIYSIGLLLKRNFMAREKNATFKTLKSQKCSHEMCCVPNKGVWKGSFPKRKFTCLLFGIKNCEHFRGVAPTKKNVCRHVKKVKLWMNISRVQLSRFYSVL